MLTASCTQLAKHVISCALLVLLLIHSGRLYAEEDNSEQLSINMRNADISAVIQWVAEQTNKKIIVDPRVKGNVTILANEAMSVEQAYQVFLAMLDVHGFAAAESGGILRIFPAAQAKTSPKALIEDFNQLEGAEQILYTFKAERVSATKLVELLRPLLPSSGHIAAFPDSNSLLIADEATNVKRLVSMVRRIDETGDLEIETLGLEHAAAATVAGLVQSLIKPGTGLAFSIVSDDRSNSLIMSGDPATRNRVRGLVKQLDKPIHGSGNTRVVYLHYLDAAELVPILRGMSLAMQQDLKKETDSPISIEPSESANALIMTAPPYLLDEMENVIAQVDIRRAQVLVEAIIVEVSKDFSKNIGVEWNTSFNRNDGAEAVTNFGLRGVNDDGDATVLGQGLNLGFFRNGNLRAVIQALANESDTNILSTPSILTLDNQEAEILVGSNVPFITGQITGSSSSTTDPFTTIERQDIGLTLKITPQVNEGDSITLDVLQEIESISDATTGARDIVTNKRSIKTKVLVEDEAILVLGGLVSDDVQQLENKVPFLGDIPLVGRLFKSTSNRVVKKNLMVFIHPVIVNSEEIAKRVSGKNYNLMKQLQEKYNQGKFTTEAIELSEFTEYKPGDKNSK